MTLASKNQLRTRNVTQSPKVASGKDEISGMRGGTSPGIRGVLVDRGISRGNLEIIQWQRGRAAVEPH